MRHKRWFYGSVSLLVVAGYAAWALLRPLPALQPVAASLPSIAPASAVLQWPAATESAVGILNTDLARDHGPQTPLPTASVAKVITALTVLKKYPLQPGQTGPLITLTDQDVALYNSYRAQDGSVVPAQAGEQISQYQLLVAMMLPSANNMADSLALWAYGSLPAYAAAANAYVAGAGMAHTHIGSDASGLSPDTVSTAHDLLTLGSLAMHNAVLAQIVAQTTATGVPLTNGVRNVNYLLGTDGIVGIKTGNSDQAGGAYLSASRILRDNQPITVITAVMGAADLTSAVSGSLPLIQSAQNSTTAKTLLPRGAIAGNYRLPWGGSVAAIAAKDVAAYSLGSDLMQPTISLNSIPASASEADVAGTVAYKNQPAQSINLKLSKRVPPPSASWRLRHPW